MIITALISIIASIMIPKLYRSNEAIHLEVSSQEVLDLFQLTQSQAHATQEPLTITVNLNNDEILGFSTLLPHHNSQTIQEKILFKPFITASINVPVTKIQFNPDLSWDAYNESHLVDSNPLSISIIAEDGKQTLLLYKYSHSIQLIK